VVLRRSHRVQALIGIAAAPDFTEWGFTDGQKEELQANGRMEEPNPYGPEPQVFTREFWDSGEQLKLLDARIDIRCPVRLVHGDKDHDVPLEIAFRTMRALRSADVQLLTIKGCGHRLSGPHEIEAILRTVAALLEPTP
jgi:pimeloyl-ACP methyl ester carboxylesterase